MRLRGKGSSKAMRRRSALAAALAAITTQAASCRLSEPDYPPGYLESLSPVDRALAHKMRGLKGGGFRVDALADIHGLNIYDERGRLFYSKALQSQTNRDFMSYSGDFGVPKSLRAVWRIGKGSARSSTNMPFDPATIEMTGNDGFIGGTIIGDYTVPVAERIPQETMDEVRKSKSGLQLKIRIHPEGVLIGWDIGAGVGNAPDGTGAIHVGGDFREATPYFFYDRRTQIVCEGMLKGWYIDPKTGQRSETDF